LDRWGNPIGRRAETEERRDSTNQSDQRRHCVQQQDQANQQGGENRLAGRSKEFPFILQNGGDVAHAVPTASVF